MTHGFVHPTAFPELPKGLKKHVNFFNISFLAPTQNPPPRKKKIMCLISYFLGKNAKKGPTSTFSGGFWGQKRGPKRAIFGHRKFSLLFFPCPYFYREQKMRTNFFGTNFWDTPRGPGHPGKIPGTSQIPPFETQEDKLSREGTNISATTPSRGRSPPHLVVSGPKKSIFVLFFLS